MEIKEALYLIIGLQTLVIVTILFSYKSKKNRINRYLSYFFMTICVEIFMYFLLKYQPNSILYYLPVRFDFLTLNFLYFYVTETAGIKIHSKFKFYIPAIIEFTILSIVLIFLVYDPGYKDYLDEYNFELYFRILSSLYIVVFSLLIIRIINRHQKLLNVHFSNVKYKSLYWLTAFCVGCIILNVLRHTYYTFNITSTFVSLAYCGLSLFLLYYVTIASLIQINIDNVIPSKSDAEEEHKQLEKIIYQVKNYLLENKTYLDPNINLKGFAKGIGISERDVSKAINRINNKNFSNYINYFRVEEFKQRLASEDYKKYSIYAIANEVGFSSRASFYKNFKEIEGVSPSVYLKNVMQ